MLTDAIITKYDWLTMQELVDLIQTDFSNPQLNLVRDVFVFSSFTGLSYAEVRSLAPIDIITGIDGKKWINKDRQKTDADETLPLLPIAQDLIDKYKDHPVCLKRNRLFPVPCNVEYNRKLKVIASLKSYKIILRTHKARFFFANEVAFDSGVDIKVIGRMLGQESLKTTEIYVSANRRKISQGMQEIEDNLFNPDGTLKALKPANRPQAKVVALTVA